MSHKKSNNKSLNFVDFLEKQEKQKDIQVNVMFLLYYII
jgi:hypothetical protein